MAGGSDKPGGPDLAKGIAASELANGAIASGHVGDEPVIVVCVGGEILAVGGKCTHYGGPLGEGLVVGDTVRCPWHHACFSLRTGEALRAPAFDPIARWNVETRDGRIVVIGKAETPEGRRPAERDGRRFVIVGGGAAGFAAAERLCREDFGGEVVIVSADPALPVDRPNLSKDFLAGKAPEDWVFIKPAEFFKERNIRLDLGTAVTRLDIGGRVAELADGRRLEFDRLLLATGAEPIRLQLPGADLPHVFTLRSLADSRAIISAAEKGRTAVVIGASFIGLEAAASLTERGLEVHVVAPDDLPLAKVLGRAFGEMVKQTHEAHGVIFHLGRRPASIDRRSVVLDDGTRLDCELVVMGVGVRPRTNLAEQSGLSVDNGVVVDACLETSAPGIFAAGDIARFPYALPGGGSVRIEHWVVAERQGQTAALNMLGQKVPFDQAPFFWSQHYDLPINYVGHAGSSDTTETVGDVAAHDGLVRFRSGRDVTAVASIFRDGESLEAEVALEEAAIPA